MIDGNFAESVDFRTTQLALLLKLPSQRQDHRTWSQDEILAHTGRDGLLCSERASR